MDSIIRKIIYSEKPVSIILGAGMTMWLGYPDFKGLYTNISKMLLNYGKITLEEFNSRMSDANGIKSSEIPRLLQEFDSSVHESIMNYIDSDFNNTDGLNKNIVNSTMYIENKKFKHLCNISKYANILTTNYDRAYEYFAEQNDVNLSKYVKLHGDLNTKKVLFKDHYEAFMFDDKFEKELDILRNTLKNHIVIYLGYSFNDDNMKFLYKYSTKEDIYIVSKDFEPESFLEENIINIEDFNQILPILSKIETSLESRNISNFNEKYYFLIKEGLEELAIEYREANNLSVFDTRKVSEKQMIEFSSDKTFNEFAKKYILVKKYDDSEKIGYKFIVNEEFIKYFNLTVQKRVLLYLPYLLRIIFYVNNQFELFTQIKAYKNYYKSHYEKNLYLLSDNLFSRTVKRKLDISKTLDLFEKVIVECNDFMFELVLKGKLLNFSIENKKYDIAREVLKDLVENSKCSPMYYVTLVELYYESEDYINAMKCVKEYFVVSNITDENNNKMKFYSYHINYCLAKTYDEEYSIFLDFRSDKSIINDAKIYICWYNELFRRGLFDDAYEMLWKAFEYDPSNMEVKDKLQKRNMGTNSGDFIYRSVTDNFEKLSKIWEIEKTNTPKVSGNYSYKLKSMHNLINIITFRFKTKNNWYHYFNKKLTENEIDKYEVFLNDGVIFSIEKLGIIGAFLNVLLAFHKENYKNVIHIYENDFSGLNLKTLELLLFDIEYKNYDFELFKTIIGIAYYNTHNFLESKSLLQEIESNYYALVYYGESVMQPGFVSEGMLIKVLDKLNKARVMRKSSLDVYFLLGTVHYGLGHVTSAEKYFSAIRNRSWMSTGHRISVYYKLIVCAVYQGDYYRDKPNYESQFKEMNDRLKSYYYNIKRDFSEFDNFTNFSVDKIRNIYGYGYFFEFIKSLYWMGSYTKNTELVKYVKDLAVYYSNQNNRYKMLLDLINENSSQEKSIIYSLI